MAAPTSTPVRREITLPASPAAVWAALTTPRELSAWFGAEATVLEARPGGRAEFRWPDGTVRAAAVEEAEPSGRLVFRWLPFDRGPDGGARSRPPTRVEITLELVPEGTRLAVVESDPATSPQGALV